MFEDGSYALAMAPAVAFLLLAGLESLRPGLELSVPLGTRWLTNVGLYAINTVLAIGMGYVGLSVANRGIQGASLGLFTAAAGGLPFWVQAVAGVLLLDLFSYATHRLMHHVRWLWPLHAVHHSDIDLDVSTGFRHHPGERVLGVLFGLGFALLLGIPVLVWTGYATVVGATGLIQHANLRLPEGLDRAVRLVVVTPGMHRHHHAVERDEHDTNYGMLFAFWDRLFGTYRDGAPEIRDTRPVGLAAFRAAREQRLDAVLGMPARLGRGGGA